MKMNILHVIFYSLIAINLMPLKTTTHLMQQIYFFWMIGMLKLNLFHRQTQGGIKPYCCRFFRVQNSNFFMIKFT